MRSLILCVLLAIASGCGAVGGVTQKVFGPPAVEARYVFKPFPTLILVENYRVPAAGQLGCELLTRQLVEQFSKHKIAPTVDTDRLYELRDSDSKAYRKLTIPEVGKSCGASQVLYVDLVELTVDSGASTVQGSSAALVRVVDVQTGATLWPQDVSGAPVGLKLPVRSLSDQVSPVSVNQRVIELTADRIARLFYTYKPDEVEKR